MPSIRAFNLYRAGVQGGSSGPRLRVAVLVAVVVGTAAPAFAADSLSGEWEIQSMGADRKVTIEQKGKKVVIHRVLWPEFEGEKYKLEHLYRGKVKGMAIQGQLLVKEDELPDWEVLRPFTGTIGEGGRLTIDGLPMKRIGGEAGAPPDVTPPSERASPPPGLARAEPTGSHGVAQAEPTAATGVAQAAPSASTGLAQAEPSTSSGLAQAEPTASPQVASAVPPPPAAPPPPSAPPAPLGGAPSGADSSIDLFASIMGSPGMSSADLFRVSNRVTIPNPVADLTAEGDVLFSKKRYEAALGKFEAAATEAKRAHAELIARMGRCHLELGNLTEAKTLLRRAVKLDPQNAQLKRDYVRAKSS